MFREQARGVVRDEENALPFDLKNVSPLQRELISLACRSLPTIVQHVTSTKNTPTIPVHLYTGSENRWVGGNDIFLIAQPSGNPTFSELIYMRSELIQTIGYENDGRGVYEFDAPFPEIGDTMPTVRFRSPSGEHVSVGFVSPTKTIEGTEFFF